MVVSVCVSIRKTWTNTLSGIFTASWEDAKHSFKNGQYFSTLDAKSGFWANLTKKVSYWLHSIHLSKILLRPPSLWTVSLQWNLLRTHGSCTTGNPWNVSLCWKGLGLFSHDSKPVLFLSQALTQTEANYANIERELLAVLFTYEKLHYTFGRKITVLTDHTKSEAIIHKPISRAPSAKDANWDIAIQIWSRFEKCIADWHTLSACWFW